MVKLPNMGLVSAWIGASATDWMVHGGGPLPNPRPLCPTCWVEWALCAAVLWSWFDRINTDEPEPDYAYTKRPHAKPPELITTSRPVQPVPQERYLFAVTNDPDVDLQPRGRNRG